MIAPSSRVKHNSLFFKFLPVQLRKLSLVSLRDIKSNHSTCQRVKPVEFRSFLPFSVISFFAPTIIFSSVSSSLSPSFSSLSVSISLYRLLVVRLCKNLKQEFQFPSSMVLYILCFPFHPPLSTTTTTSQFICICSLTFNLS